MFQYPMRTTNLMVTALKYFIHIIYFSASGHFGGIFEPIILVYIPLFLESPSIFLMKFCTDFFGITLTITFSLLGAILQYFGDYFENFLMKFRMDVPGSFFINGTKLLRLGRDDNPEFFHF